VLLLLVLSPLILAIAIAIKLEDGGSVLFAQERIGRDGRAFRLWKFRTMEVATVGAVPVQVVGMTIAAAVARLKTPTAEMTRVGHWLRRSSLDELPQLWSIICGEMSLVGPRPLRDFEVAALSGWELERMRVLPGLSGLWQVLGRSDTPWDERMKLDYLYARHGSLALDFRILLRTIPAVLSARGAL
jgi:lipopolysaccharide/colanic/teichoic acid biosynthesis glycosyltransferase